MITMTEVAQKELEAYFEGKEREVIRVYMAHGGCSGPKLAMALDAAGEDDETCTTAGFTFCMEKPLIAILGDITIDLGPMGFIIESANPLPVSEGHGGGCCGSCSCGSSCGS